MDTVSLGNVCTSLWDDVQQRAPYLLPAVGALAVAGAVYLVWGKFACMLVVAAAALTFQLTDRAREIVRFDFSTLGILVAAIGMPFLGGPLAYLGGGYMASSLVIHQWKQYKIFRDIKREKESLETQNRNLTSTAEIVRTQASRLQGFLVKLGLAKQTLEQRNRADQTLIAQNRALDQVLLILDEELEIVNKAFDLVNAKADVMQTVATYTNLLQEIRQEKESFVGQVNQSLAGLDDQKRIVLAFEQRLEAVLKTWESRVTPVTV